MTQRGARLLGNTLDLAGQAGKVAGLLQTGGMPPLLPKAPEHSRSRVAGSLKPLTFSQKSLHGAFSLASCIAAELDSRRSHWLRGQKLGYGNGRDHRALPLHRARKAQYAVES